ncbi:MAG: O-antigen ligase family protein [Pyrinomonadaceae bacterium]|nr:O-antigen ligase family protein [Pyrinomonadaceae bacterium]MCX7638945.1 O-antigen ligase family protein [Pyrinomonadaceae bacterium]MDW8304918.1 O-antigen ligase family protein [Acidobacteriota bacterium]
MSLQVAKYLFLLYIFSLGYMQPSFKIAGFTIPPSDLIFTLTFLFWLASIIKKGDYLFRSSISFVPLSVYFLAVCLSVLFSDSVQVSLIKLLGVAYLLMIPIVTLNLIENETDLEKAVVALIYGSLIAIFVGILSIAFFYLDNSNPLLYFTTYHYGSVPVGRYPRIRSTFVTPSLLFNYLSVVLAILLAAVEKELIKRKALILMIFATLTVCVFTFSSGFGGIFLTAGLWIYLEQDKKLAKTLSLLLSGLVALLLYLVNFIALQPHSTAPFSFKIFGLEFFPSARLLVWIDSTKTFLENPLFGKGIGTNSCQVLFQNTDGSFSFLTDAHNIFLSVATQSGIFGLIGILLIMIVVLRMSSKSNVLQRAFIIAFISAFVYQGLVGAFEDARHLWLLIGFIITAKNLELDSRRMKHL